MMLSQCSVNTRSLLAVIALGMLLCVAAQASGVPRDKPRHDYDMRHIRLDLRFDWTLEQASGKAGITVAPLVDGLQQLELDAADLTVSSVKTNSGKPLVYQSNPQAKKLKITLDRAYKTSETLTFVIEYKTGEKSEHGLTFIKPTADEPNNPRQIWSAGQPENSRYWFPCYDSPDDFVTSEVLATVDGNFLAISNGKLLGVRNEGPVRTFHWKMDQPHAVYLTSIIVGEYVALKSNYQGIPITSYVYPQQKKEGEITTARVRDMIKFLSEKTGVKYPFAGYSQTVVRHFTPVGLENITATTVDDSIIRDERAMLDATSDTLQAHEVAHQWFGNYLTCRTWADSWLNESFATYFQSLFDEETFGRDEFIYRNVRSNQNVYYSVLAGPARRPLVNKDYTDPSETLGPNAYAGGAVVLHMLRTTLGDENWWRGVRNYLRKHPHQPVETEDLRKAFEEATGQKLDWFFDQWVYRIGYPIFRVTQNYDPQKRQLVLTVRQEQTPAPNITAPQSGLFRALVEIEIGTARSTRIERVWIEPKLEQSLTFNVDEAPLLVNFDYGSTLFKELRFQKTNEELIYQLAHDKDVAGRLWAINQLSFRLRDQNLPATDKPPIAAAIISAVKGDSFWGMRANAATSLRFASGEEPRAALMAATKDSDPRVRMPAIASLGVRNDPALATVYLEHLNDPSYATVRAAAMALAQSKSPLAYDALAKLAGQSSWRDTIRVSALDALGVLGDQRAVELGTSYATRGQPLAVRRAALSLLAAVGKQEPRVFPLLSEALFTAVAANNETLINAASQALLALGDERGLNVLREASEKTGDESTKTFLLKSEERLRQQKPN
jgi:aminopeptidase N